jgi:hypothetical protein
VFPYRTHMPNSLLSPNNPYLFCMFICPLSVPAVVVPFTSFLIPALGDAMPCVMEQDHTTEVIQLSQPAAIGGAGRMSPCHVGIISPWRAKCRSEACLDQPYQPMLW